MSYTTSTSEMTLIAHGSTSQLFHYTTNDNATAVAAANYFDDAIDDVNLTRGDIILAALDMDGTEVLKMYLVSDITSGAVTVASLTAG